MEKLFKCPCCCEYCWEEYNEEAIESNSSDEDEEEEEEEEDCFNYAGERSKSFL